MLLGSLLATFSLFTIIWAQCPDDLDIGPCICDKDQGISCSGENVTDLVPVFAKLSQLDYTKKKFRLFALAHSNVKELPANLFKDVLFTDLHLAYNFQLERIHQDAFYLTQYTVKTVTLESNLKLAERIEDNAHLFNALSAMPEIQSIRLLNNGFSEIPGNAFTPANGQPNLDKLIHLEFQGYSLNKIVDSPFATLNNLKWLSFYKTGISSFGPHSLLIGSSSMSLTEPVDVRLHENSLVTPSSFHQAGWLHVPSTRPLALRITFNDVINKMPQLDMCHFEYLLAVNPANTLDINYSGLDCSYCGNQWVLDYPGRVLFHSWFNCSDSAAPKFSNCPKWNCGH